MWRYDSRSGRFYSPEGQQIGWGYSGRKGRYRNNPDLEHVVGSGCIPTGLYVIGPPRHSARVGPIAMDLEPVGHTARGRTALMIHGDNSRGDASRGCLILNRNLRVRIAQSSEEYLEVFDSRFPDEPEGPPLAAPARPARTPAQEAVEPPLSARCALNWPSQPDEWLHVRVLAGHVTGSDVECIQIRRRRGLD